MAQMQMAIMGRKPTLTEGAGGGGGGGDSAYLQAGEFDGALTSTISISIAFNPTDQDGTVTYNHSGVSSPENYTWKTGPHPSTEYKAKYIETSASGLQVVDGTLVDMNFVSMTTNGPQLSLGAGSSTSWSYGYLVIVHQSNESVELANCYIQMATNTNV